MVDKSNNFNPMLKIKTYNESILLMTSNCNLQKPTTNLFNETKIKENEEQDRRKR